VILAYKKSIGFINKFYFFILDSKQNSRVLSFNLALKTNIAGKIFPPYRDLILWKHKK